MNDTADCHKCWLANKDYHQIIETNTKYKMVKKYIQAHLEVLHTKITSFKGSLNHYLYVLRRAAIMNVIDMFNDDNLFLSDE
jgi:hypothetical protein